MPPEAARVWPFPPDPDTSEGIRYVCRSLHRRPVNLQIGQDRAPGERPGRHGSGQYTVVCQALNVLAQCGIAGRNRRAGQHNSAQQEERNSSKAVE